MHNGMVFGEKHGNWHGDSCCLLHLALMKVISAGKISLLEWLRKYKEFPATCSGQANVSVRIRNRNILGS
jgi:hypothetical protein